MRWFVEVSRVGEDDSTERYCIEAKAWQAALQEARKRRGDSGPLSKFSIELLDGGYRAIDPVRKIRYVVNEAPGDAPLDAPAATNGAGQAPATAPTPKAASEQSSPRPSASPASAQPSTASSTAPREEPSQSAPAAAPAAARSAAPSVAGAASVPATSSVPAASPSASASSPAAARTSSTSPARVSEGASAERGQPALASAQPAGGSRPTAAPAPGAPATRSQPATAASTRAVGASSPATNAAASGVVRASQPVSTPSDPSLRFSGYPRASVPAPSLYRRSFYRHEDPRPEMPLTYREEVYVVEPGTPLPAVEALLAEQFEAVRRELAALPPGKLVRLAVFDVEFKGPAPRPPLGVLAWKDWHAAPSYGFPAFGTEAPVVTSSLPPRPEGRASEPTATARASAPSAPAASPSPATTPAVRERVDSERGVELEPPIASGTFVRSEPPRTSAPPTASKAPSSAKADGAPSEAARATAKAESAPSTRAHGEGAPNEAARASVKAAAAPGEAARVGAKASEAPSEAAEIRKPVPAPATASGPRNEPPRARRRAREDLVSELFERLHELRFATDLVSGADFVLDVLAEVIPSELGMVQVFDINSRSFVVIRVRGGNLGQALLHRTPDTDPFVAEVMRRPAPIAFRAEEVPRAVSGRWEHAGTPLGWVLSGGVRQGGRYLGMIELANPAGGTPFEDTEINAFDYACAQFADLVATRPVVLDREIILAR